MGGRARRRGGGCRVVVLVLVMLPRLAVRAPRALAAAFAPTLFAPIFIARTAAAAASALARRLLGAVARHRNLVTGRDWCDRSED